MLKITNLNKYYHTGFLKRLHVVNNTSIEIPDKGIIAVIGKSGVGKSSLLNAISGLDDFKDGSIEFNGTKLTKYDPKKSDKLRMENFGFIFQNYFLVKDKTVFENVCESLDNFSLTNEEKKKRINYVLKELGIVKYTNKLVGNLSGGEQQRVSIARALVKSPKVIFADEPTGSLDEKTTFTVLNILKKVSENCAIFIVTHEKEIISYYADYIIELDKGTVINEFVPKTGEKEYLSVDQNIYLDEFENKTTIDNDKVNINIYTDSNEISKINIDIAIKNGKIYLESNEKINFINDETETKLIHNKRYAINNFVKEEFDFKLDDITYDPKALSVKKMLNKSFQNYKTKNLFKTLFRILMVVIGFLAIFLFDSIKGLDNANLALNLSNAKGSITFTLESENIKTNSETLTKIREDIVSKLQKEDLGGNILFGSTEQLSYQYVGFFQYEQKTYNINSCDFKSLKYLNEKDLIYGRMPEKRNEIVIDEYVLERFKQNNYLSNIITNIKYFIGKEFKGTNSGTIYTVSGISRTKNPVFYGHECLNFAWLGDAGNTKAITLDLFKKEYPEYNNISLDSGEILMNANYIKDFGFNIKGQFDKDIPYNIVILESDLKALKEKVAHYSIRVTVETDGNKETIDSYINLINKINSEHKVDNNTNQAKVNLTNKYELEYAKATESAVSLIRILSIISSIFAIISIMFVILLMNKSLTNQIIEIAILRSLGYPRIYTFITYFSELVMNSLIHVFMGVFITYIVMNIISVIPIFSYSIAVNMLDVLVITLLSSGVIVIIGMIPLLNLIRKTPTQIYNTYSKKIES